MVASPTDLRKRLMALLPILLLMLIIGGNLMVVAKTILPAWKDYDALQNEVSMARTAVEDKLSSQDGQEELDITRLRVDNMATQMYDSAALLLTKQQLDTVLSHIYDYANKNNVAIADLQLQGDPALIAANAGSANLSTSTAFETRVFKLQVTGPMRQLMSFVVDARELSALGVVISDFSISPDDSSSIAVQPLTLAMTLTMYSSPHASGNALTNLPEPGQPVLVLPTATLTPIATNTPDPSVTPTITPTPLPPTITPSMTPTFTATATITPTPTSMVTATEPVPTATPTLLGQCLPVGGDIMATLIFSKVQKATGFCNIQVWPFDLDQAYDFVLDIVRRSGDAHYRMELRDSENKLISATESSADGRGILVAHTDSGHFNLNIIPISSTGPWEYNVAIWQGMPVISLAWRQSSFSSHTSVEGQQNVTAWRYTVNNAVETYQVDVKRTDGNLEYNLVVLDADRKTIASTRSIDGAVSITITSKRGVYYTVLTAVEGTSGSYSIGLLQ